MLDAEDRPQILELNTIPGLTETGPTPFAAEAAGMSFAATGRGDRPPRGIRETLSGVAGGGSRPQHSQQLATPRRRRPMTDLTQAPDQTAAQDAVAHWLRDFNAALAAESADAAAELFAIDAFWRDLVALTWNLKTLEGRDQIRAMLSQSAGGHRARVTSSPPSRPPRPTA